MRQFEGLTRIRLEEVPFSFECEDELLEKWQTVEFLRVTSELLLGKTGRIALLVSG